VRSLALAVGTRRWRSLWVRAALSGRAVRNSTK